MLLMLAMVSVVTIMWADPHLALLAPVQTNLESNGPWESRPLVAAYVAAVLVFRAAFDFSFLEHTPRLCRQSRPKRMGECLGGAISPGHERSR